MTLDKKSAELLKYLAEHPRSSIAQIDKITSSAARINPYLKELRDRGFVECAELDESSPGIEWLTSVTPGGQAYLEEKQAAREEKEAEQKAKKADNRRWLITWSITTTISLIALIKSFMPEIIALWKLLTQQ